MADAVPRTVLIITLFTVAIALIACVPVTPGIRVDGTFEQPAAFDPARELDAVQFRSEDEFLAFVGSQGDGGFGRDVLTMDADIAVGAPAKAMEESAGGSDYSGTNNQVVGVDEADILKTDGEYAYTTTGRTLFLIRAYPGEEAEVLGSLDLDVEPVGLFVDGDNLAVIGSYHDNEYFAKIGIRPRNGFTRVTIYDVSDRSAPRELETYTLEGSYSGARMKDGIVYLILTSGPDYRLENPTPLIVRDDVVSSVPVRDAYWYPIPYQYMQFATTHAIGLRDPDRPIESVTIAVEGQNALYMSENAIYLAATEWINEWELRQEILRDLVGPKLSAQDKALIAKIEAADLDILSVPEKRSRIDQIHNEYVAYLLGKEQQDINEEIDARLAERLDAFEALEWTVINRIDVDGGISVGPTGKVPGSVYGQFALDENDGYLRVATTVNQRWRIRPMMRGGVGVVQAGVAAEPSEVETGIDGMELKGVPNVRPPPSEQSSSNSVYVLDESLDVVGEITSIAPGETIQSARYIGDRLYLVTFRQVDPFFVIDLSDPRDPEIIGQLKVPGFSRYLHPYDEDTIIGIGRDATAAGRQQGLKIALYDVSDVTKPKELALWVSDEEWAQSTAEWEHKAFLFDHDRELLVIPAYGYDWRGSESYNGAMVFRVTPASVTLRGIVDHGAGQYGATVERSFFIDGLLYTKSPNLLRINALDDLSSVKRLPLVTEGPYPVY